MRDHIPGSIGQIAHTNAPHSLASKSVGRISKAYDLVLYYHGECHVSVAKLWRPRHALDPIPIGLIQYIASLHHLSIPIPIGLRPTDWRLASIWLLISYAEEGDPRMEFRIRSTFIAGEVAGYVYRVTRWVHGSEFPVKPAVVVGIVDITRAIAVD